jgi:hypothetical protein
MRVNFEELGPFEMERHLPCYPMKTLPNRPVGGPARRRSDFSVSRVGFEK